jgi:hypothetical protein
MLGMVSKGSRIVESASIKPRLLIVDHEFHRKTRSFDFLFTLLEDRFETRKVYLDPEAPIDRETLLDDSEYVFICQLDFLTPLFIAAGKRVVVVQMYDGSSGLPADHWVLNRQASYLNFSVALHARALEYGASSKLVRFFPDPDTFPQVKSFKPLDLFFWQRLPGSTVNLSTVGRLLGSQVDSLHVHTPADDGSPFDPSMLDAIKARTTTSNWFATRDEFLDTLARCNVYLAPRLAEGIGHGFLEALARGMVVLAHDAPTHNEYVANGLTGILFNDNSGFIKLTEKERSAIGGAARLAVENGFRQWSEQKLAIADWVLGVPAAKVPSGVSLDKEIDAVLASYQKGLAPYVQQLKDSRALVAILGHWHELEAGDQTVASLALDAGQGGEPATPALARHRIADIFAGSTYGPDVSFTGWSEPEWSHRWAVQREASLLVKTGSKAPISAIEFEMRALRPLPMTISLNGVKVGRIEVGASFERSRLELTQPLQVKAGEPLRIDFRSERPFYRRMPRVEIRPLTFCLKSLSLLTN